MKNKQGFPEQDWNRPVGCDCRTLARRARCENNCDPVKPRAKRRLGPIGAAVTIALIVGLAHLFLLSSARPADLNLYFSDPYACFGSARYEAMSRGLACPSKAEWQDTPSYCEALKLMDRSCISVKAVAKVFGRAGAERRARKCGATDADIAEANTCFQPK